MDRRRDADGEMFLIQEKSPLLHRQAQFQKMLTHHKSSFDKKKGN